MNCGFAEFCGCAGTFGYGRKKNIPMASVKLGKKCQRDLVDAAAVCTLAKKELVKSHGMLVGVSLWLECICGDKEAAL